MEVCGLSVSVVLPNFSGDPYSSGVKCDNELSLECLHPTEDSVCLSRCHGLSLPMV